jgi:S-adenosylmethionine:tRNA ribosyltransferase-isomerase
MGVGVAVPDEPGAEDWDALVHPGQKLKPGSRVVFDGEGMTLDAEILDWRFHGRRRVRLRTAAGRSVTETVDALGHVPLPPYIHRPDRPEDRDRYQTVYARERGSIAAPTAGLHFTAGLLSELADKGIERTHVTLHVGYGTFKPVRVETVEEHTVDPERFEVTPDAAAALSRARRDGRRVIAVGTTTVRVLESLELSDSGEIRSATGETNTFIYPGHRFQLVDGLITNFHLPRSSLLMLVCAFGGRVAVLRAYNEAVARGYRFYSYGDAMLVV